LHHESDSHESDSHASDSHASDSHASDSHASCIGRDLASCFGRDVASCIRQSCIACSRQSARRGRTFASCPSGRRRGTRFICKFAPHLLGDVLFFSTFVMVRLAPLKTAKKGSAFFQSLNFLAYGSPGTSTVHCLPKRSPSHFQSGGEVRASK